MMLAPWAERWAAEEANHFNPAYCGALIYEFARSYRNTKRRAASFALVFCALPIALHPDTRDRLPPTTKSGMFPWLEENRDVRVGFGTRARNLAPYVKGRAALRNGATGSPPRRRRCAWDWAEARVVYRCGSRGNDDGRAKHGPRACGWWRGGSRVPGTLLRYWLDGGSAYELHVALGGGLQRSGREPVDRISPVRAERVDGSSEEGEVGDYRHRGLLPRAQRVLCGRRGDLGARVVVRCRDRAGRRRAVHRTEVPGRREANKSRHIRPPRRVRELAES